MSDPKLPPDRNFCKCTGCNQYFFNVKAFDTHRIGASLFRKSQDLDDLRCMTDSEMQNASLHVNDKGYWRLPKRKF